jgi:hypothetical protein
MELSPDDIRALREWKAWLRTNGSRVTANDYVVSKPARMITKARSLKLIKAPEGGIPGRVGTLLGGVICDVWSEASVTQQIQDSGNDIKVYNWTTSAACVNGDRFGIAGWVNGGWYIIAEDCNDEGSTVEPGTGSGSGSTVGDAIDTSTLTPLVTIGVGGSVSYTSGATPIP